MVVEKKRGFQPQPCITDFPAVGLFSSACPTFRTPEDLPCKPRLGDMRTRPPALEARAGFAHTANHDVMDFLGRHMLIVTWSTHSMDWCTPRSYLGIEAC